MVVRVQQTSRQSTVNALPDTRMASAVSSDANGSSVAVGETGLAQAVRQRRHAVRVKQQREERARQLREAELEKERERRRRTGAQRQALSLQKHSRLMQRRDREGFWGQDAQGLLDKKRLRELQHRLINQTPPFGTLEFCEYRKLQEDALIALIDRRVAPAAAQAERRRWARALRARPASMNSKRCCIVAENAADDMGSSGMAGMSLHLRAPENTEDYEFFTRLLAWRKLMQLSDARREVNLRYQQLRVALDHEMTLLEQDYAAARQHLVRIALTMNAAKQAEIESRLVALASSNRAAASKSGLTDARILNNGSAAAAADATTITTTTAISGNAEGQPGNETKFEVPSLQLSRLLRGGQGPAMRTRRGRNSGPNIGYLGTSDLESVHGDPSAPAASTKTNTATAAAAAAAGNGQGAAPAEAPAIISAADADVWVPITTPGMMLSESVRALAMPPVRTPAGWLRKSSLLKLVAGSALLPEVPDSTADEQPRIRVALDGAEIQRDLRQVVNAARSLERLKRHMEEEEEDERA